MGYSLAIDAAPGGALLLKDPAQGHSSSYKYRSLDTEFHPRVSGVWGHEAKSFEQAQLDLLPAPGPPQRASTSPRTEAESGAAHAHGAGQPICSVKLL